MAKRKLRQNLATPGTQEFGWVVGFLEGEGSFGASFPKSRRGVRIWARASQVQREPLDRMTRYTGLGRVTGPRQPKSPLKASPIYLWRLEDGSCVDFMRELRAFMSPKRQAQIDEALARWEARPRPDYQSRLRHAWETRRARGWKHPGFKAKDHRQLHLITGTGGE